MKVGIILDPKQLENLQIKIYSRKSNRGTYMIIGPQRESLFNSRIHWKKLTRDQKFITNIHPSLIQSGIIVTQIFKTEARIEFRWGGIDPDTEQFIPVIFDCLKLKIADLKKLTQIGQIDPSIITIANGFWEDFKKQRYFH